MRSAHCCMPIVCSLYESNCVKFTHFVTKLIHCSKNWTRYGYSQASSSFVVPEVLCSLFQDYSTPLSGLQYSSFKTTVFLI